MPNMLETFDCAIRLITIEESARNSQALKALAERMPFKDLDHLLASQTGQPTSLEDRRVYDARYTDSQFASKFSPLDALHYYQSIIRRIDRSGVLDNHVSHRTRQLRLGYALYLVGRIRHTSISLPEKTGS
ncbi:unnamed protein product [Somion occarium]|uniref:Uncharacterized protein n=1 Tax=Somion occarium TaxID=3059160 RepID=A0ABP1CW49_9APHY